MKWNCSRDTNAMEGIWLKLKNINFRFRYNPRPKQPTRWRCRRVPSFWLRPCRRGARLPPCRSPWLPPCRSPWLPPCRGTWLRPDRCTPATSISSGTKSLESYPYFFQISKSVLEWNSEILLEQHRLYFLGLYRILICPDIRLNSLYRNLKKKKWLLYLKKAGYPVQPYYFPPKSWLIWRWQADV